MLVKQMDGHVTHTLCLQFEWTPLYAAAFRGHKDVVALLLAEGAKVDVPDNVSVVPTVF
jgi:ankyrin repeat protein